MPSGIRMPSLRSANSVDFNFSMLCCYRMISSYILGTNRAEGIHQCKEGIRKGYVESGRKELEAAGGYTRRMCGHPDIQYASLA